MTKILVLIDGFNYYHRLDDYSNNFNEHVKWLNYKALIESYLQNETVKKLDIFYFSAYATHRHKNCIKKHKTYVKALNSVGVIEVMGQFKKKFIMRCKSKERCSTCKCLQDSTELVRHEEKNTDVNIAVKLIESAINRKYDKCFILSSDNDFSSAIKRAKELNRSMQIIICPPPASDQKIINSKKARIRVKDLEKACGCQALIINWNRIKSSQFPDDFNNLINPWI